MQRHQKQPAILLKSSSCFPDKAHSTSECAAVFTTRNRFFERTSIGALPLFGRYFNSTSAPLARLVDEAAKGGGLPDTAHDYGFLRPGRVSRESLVAVEGNQYSVPVPHVGAPVTVRLHQERVRIWRDTTCLADHPRAPDGARQRVIDPAHFAPLFPAKSRAQVMLYRQALLWRPLTHPTKASFPVRLI